MLEQDRKLEIATSRRLGREKRTRCVKLLWYTQRICLFGTLWVSCWLFLCGSREYSSHTLEIFFFFQWQGWQMFDFFFMPNKNFTMKIFVHILLTTLWRYKLYHKIYTRLTCTIQWILVNWLNATTITTLPF